MGWGRVGGHGGHHHHYGNHGGYYDRGPRHGGGYREVEVHTTVREYGRRGGGPVFPPSHYRGSYDTYSTRVYYPAPRPYYSDRGYGNGYRPCHQGQPIGQLFRALGVAAGGIAEIVAQNRQARQYAIHNW